MDQPFRYNGTEEVRIRWGLISEGSIVITIVTAMSTKVIKPMVFLGQVQDRRPQEMDFPVGTFRLGV